MKKNNNGITELVFILDRSGSMAGLERDTIGGFNAMIEKQKKEPGTAYVSTVIFDRDELDNFRQMMRDGGRGIWKSGDGDVYDADFEFSYSSDYKGSQWRYNCTLNVTRIDGAY